MRMAGGRLALILVGASSHLPAVSHQDSLSVTLCQCWIIVGNLFLLGEVSCWYFPTFFYPDTKIVVKTGSV